VIDWSGWHVSGLLAWLIWSFAHVWFLVGFRSRLIVSLQWLWNYLTYQRSARLITGEDVAPQLQIGNRKAA
jgi:NADH dehydrogenase